MLKKLKSMINKDKSKLSIDIGAKNIKIVEGYFNGNSVVVENMLVFPTPSNSYEDGKIIELNLLSNSIYTALNNEDIKSKDVIYTVSSKSILNRTIELPSTKDEDIENMLEFEVEQHFPVDLDDYVVQHQIVEKIETEPKRSMVLVSALPKLIVEKYLSLTKSLDLNPLVLDMNANSIAKLVYEEARAKRKLDSLKENTVAVLDIGFNDTNIIILDRGKLKFNRHIDFGSKKIDMSIANSFNLSLEEAEIKKLEIKELALDEEDISRDLIKETIKSILGNFCIEIEKIFKFYITRSTSNEIQGVYLYGATSKTKGLKEYVEENLEVPTYDLRDLKIVENKMNKNTNMIQYANAIGALIRK